MAQDPLGDSSTNHWEEKLFDQSRSIEPKDGPVKTTVSNVVSIGHTLTPSFIIIVQKNLYTPQVANLKTMFRILPCGCMETQE